jgi:hypothetical protein
VEVATCPRFPPWCVIQEFFGRIGRDESSDLVLNGERMALEWVVKVEMSGRERGFGSIDVRLWSTIDVSDLIATPVQSLLDLDQPGLYSEICA